MKSLVVTDTHVLVWISVLILHRHVMETPNSSYVVIINQLPVKSYVEVFLCNI